MISSHVLRGRYGRTPFKREKIMGQRARRGFLNVARLLQNPAIRSTGPQHIDFMQ